jgi:hypothetical protein
MNAKTQHHQTQASHRGQHSEITGRIGVLSVLLKGVVSESSGKPNKKRAGNFEPQLMERPDETAKNQFELASHVVNSILLERPQIEN